MPSAHAASRKNALMSRLYRQSFSKLLNLVAVRVLVNTVDQKENITNISEERHSYISDICIALLVLSK